jgi:hypothetical protein
MTEVRTATTLRQRDEIIASIFQLRETPSASPR